MDPVGLKAFIIVIAALVIITAIFRGGDND